MVSSEYRQQYQSRYVTARSSDGAGPSDSPILQDSLGVEGQVTTLRVYADEAVDITVSIAPVKPGVDISDGIDASDLENPIDKIHLEGHTQYALGDFENPAVELGARNVIQINLGTSLGADSSVSVNARIDERTS
jgi:hypothetical protein